MERWPFIKSQNTSRLSIMDDALCLDNKRHLSITKSCAQYLGNHWSFHMMNFQEFSRESTFLSPRWLMHNPAHPKKAPTLLGCPLLFSIAIRASLVKETNPWLTKIMQVGYLKEFKKILIFYSNNRHDLKKRANIKKLITNVFFLKFTLISHVFMKNLCSVLSFPVQMNYLTDLCSAV